MLKVASRENLKKMTGGFMSKGRMSAEEQEGFLKWVDRHSSKNPHYDRLTVERHIGNPLTEDEWRNIRAYPSVCRECEAIDIRVELRSLSPRMFIADIECSVCAERYSVMLWNDMLGM